MSDEIDALSVRMDDAEQNIVATMYVANAAYNKANEVGEISEEAIKKALESLGVANDVADKTNGFESQLASINQVSAQARAIAESAITSAISLKDEAIAASNQAVADASRLRDEFAQQTMEVSAALELASSKLDEARNINSNISSRVLGMGKFLIIIIL